MTVQPFDFVAAGLAAASVIVFWYGLVTTRRRRALEQRLHVHVGAEDLAAALATQDQEPAGGAALAMDLARRLSRSSYGAYAQQRLVRAGLALLPARFVQIQVAAAALASLAALMVVAPAGGVVRFAAAAVAAAGGFSIPLLALSVRESRRLAAFERQLAQAIDSMAGTLQAGSALPQAMEVIGREMPPPISVEFRRVLREMELGLTLTDSLSNLQDRVRSADIVLLTSAISIQNRVGGDLASIFRTISNTIRERLRIRGEINVLTAQGRYSAYIITGLPFALFALMWLINRPYISQLFQPGITRAMLAGGLMGIALGYYSMKKIVSIEV